MKSQRARKQANIRSSFRRENFHVRIKVLTNTVDTNGNTKSLGIKNNQMEILELKQKIQHENLLDGQNKDRGKSVNLKIEQWKLATLKNIGLLILQKRLRK